MMGGGGGAVTEVHTLFYTQKNPNFRINCTYVIVKLSWWNVQYTKKSLFFCYPKNLFRPKFQTQKITQAQLYVYDSVNEFYHLSDWFRLSMIVFDTFLLGFSWMQTKTFNYHLNFSHSLPFSLQSCKNRTTHQCNVLF